MLDLKEIIIKQVTDGISEKLASSLNLPEAQVKKGVMIIVPYIIGALTKSNTTDGLLSKLETTDLRANLDENSNNSTLLELGSSMLDQFLSSEKEEIVTKVSDATQLEPTSANSLLNMALPVLLNNLSKAKTDNNLDLTQLSDMLSNVDKESLAKDLGKQLLDKDGDGNIVDDLMDLGKGLFK